MLKKILLVVVVLSIVLIVVIAMRPADFEVTRSATIAAPPSAVFPHVNNFHNWQSWSPWEKLDPEMKKTFEGPAEGVGAKYAWSGDEVGEGRMTITESRPNELVLINLEFLKPFESTNTTQFTFKPEGNGTNVTWTMSGRHNFMGKAFDLFMNMDKMLGSDFDKGLAEMKSVVEAQQGKAKTNRRLRRLFEESIEYLVKS